MTASGNARVMLTGGNASGNARGGLGVNGSVTASGNAIVEITAGDGSTGGNGIYGDYMLTISENASVKVKGGNATNTDKNAGDAINQVNYQGGSLTVTGGVNSLNAARNGKAITTSITNNSGSSVDFEYSTDGTTWTTKQMTDAGPWNDANVNSRFVRTKQ